MNFTDTHTHLYSEEFQNDQNAMIERAIAAGVKQFFVPAIDSKYTASMLDLKGRFPSNIYLMCGLHPTHVQENYKEELLHVQHMLEKESYVAVGEIGMDLFWDTQFKTQQQEAFHTQIHWALERNLPIVIHCRDAFDEVFEVLESYRGTVLHGIFHCFTGNLQQAQQAVDLNFKLGIGGVVTFKNGKVDQFLHEIAMEHIVLETDAPYLSPVPYRGKRNESAYLPLIADKVAQIYGLTVEQVAQQTTLNSIQVFGV